jgi:hypothetical protein
VTEGPLRRLASIVAMDVERGQSRCGRNPCDISEFVDLVGIADDMTHRPLPTPSARSLGPSAVVAGMMTGAGPFAGSPPRRTRTSRPPS